MSQKIVINKCFGLSDEAIFRYCEIKGMSYDKNKYTFNHRNDPILVQVVGELCEKASDRYANLKVVEIPDEVEWEIDKYDGYEQVEEVHRKWS